MPDALSADYVGAADLRECETPGVCPHNAACIEKVNDEPECMCNVPYSFNSKKSARARP